MPHRSNQPDRAPAPPRAAVDPAAMRARIERALEREEPDLEIIPMLERLQRSVPPDSEHRRYAERRLAELLLEAEPWRAAGHLRRLIAEGGQDDDALWALMGLAQALLGHHKVAAAAYRRALAIQPGNPWYAHNLGHMLDVGLDRPHEAVLHLELAHQRQPGAVAIACSFAHVLWRVGRLEQARSVLRPLLPRHRYDPDVMALAVQLAVRGAGEVGRTRGKGRRAPPREEPG